MRDARDLARQAAGQHGLLTSDDLHRLGVTRHQRATLTSCGVLRRVRKGLFVLAGAPETWEHLVLRACLSIGPHAVASHRSALRLWGLRRDDDRVEVTAPMGRTQRIDGAVVHRSDDLEPMDVRCVDGLPVTSVARTLCDAGAVLPERVVGWMIERAIGTRLVTQEELWQFRRRVGRQGRTGVGPLDRQLRELPATASDAESPPEISLARILRDHGLPEPVPQYVVEVSGKRFRPDFAYPDARLVLEYDGYEAHIDPEQFARDRWRQNLLMLGGWTVLRYTKEDLRLRSTWLAGQVRDALRRVA